MVRRLALIALVGTATLVSSTLSQAPAAPSQRPPVTVAVDPPHLSSHGAPTVTVNAFAAGSAAVTRAVVYSAKVQRNKDLAAFYAAVIKVKEERQAQRQRRTTPATMTPRTTNYAGCGTIDAIIRQVWRPDLWSWAYHIAFRESRCQPGAYNSSSASGIFQIKYPMHASWFAAVGCPGQPFDATCNIKAAFYGVTNYGTGPWSL